MTMTKFFRTALILMLAVLMVVSIAACGKNDAASGSDTSSGASSGDAGDSGNVAVQGKTETWGNITVAVPEGMNLKGGNALDENNPDVVNISEANNAMHYFLITVVDTEEQAASDIDSTREFNEGSQDVTVDAGVQWKGVQYDYSGSPATPACSSSATAAASPTPCRTPPPAASAWPDISRQSKRIKPPLRGSRKRTSGSMCTIGQGG